MPAIGQLKFCLADSGLAFALGNLDRNFLPLVFIREEDALDFAFRFATIDRGTLVSGRASHKVHCGTG